MINRNVSEYSKDMNKLVIHKGQLGTIVTKDSIPVERLFLPTSHRGTYMTEELDKIEYDYLEIEPSDVDTIIRYVNILDNKSVFRTLLSVCYVPNGTILGTYLDKKTKEQAFSCSLVSDILKTSRVSSKMYHTVDEAIIGAIVERYQGLNSRLEVFIPKMLGIGGIYDKN